MYYAIDHDTRKVVCKHDMSTEMEEYLSANGLDLAVTLIGDEDELCLMFTLEEIEGVLATHNQKSREWEDEEEAARFLWSFMEGNTHIPAFSKRSAKKLLGTSAQTDTPEPTEKQPKPKAAKPASAPRTSKGVRAKDLIGMTFCAGSNVPRKGTSFEIFANFLEDNLDEATFDELVQAFIENYVPKNPAKPVDETLAKAYVRDGFNGGYIEEAL